MCDAGDAAALPQGGLRSLKEVPDLPQLRGGRDGCEGWVGGGYTVDTISLSSH